MDASETLIPLSHFQLSAPHLTPESYHAMYARSMADPEGFWADMAERFFWHKRWTSVQDSSFTGEIRIRWFEGAQLNITENCLDRHLATQPDKPAILWEPDTPGAARTLSYRELHAEVCRMANGLRALGVKRGDRVTIYMPMVPEAAIAMLAVARIGAVHSVVFGGFSVDALHNRIRDCGSHVILTADEGVRAGKTIPLKANVDAAIEGLDIRHVVVYPRTAANVAWDSARDVRWSDMLSGQRADCPAEVMESEDPLFILYTSGSTGKPKGLLHTCGGYMVYAGLTTQYAFDLQPEDVYWCTADIGWITGHSYLVYGPLLNGATSLMFEGVPTYPDASRYWQVVDKHKVSIFYTAPTAIRSLMQLGDAPVAATSRASLRILGSVGEPINPEAWLWYFHTVGGARCPVVDTWWQTETGGHMLLPIPNTAALKPGSATWPFFGVRPEICDAQGKPVEGEAEGELCIGASWPGQARTIWGDHKRFKETYFTSIPGKFATSDGCRRDKDGYYWIAGRMDDVIKVSGHRLGTAEIESALDAHEAVAEAAVVGFPHEIKGQSVYAYVILKEGIVGGATLEQDLRQFVRARMGAFAAPEHIHFTPALPKTRSGKIMRRILRKIAEGKMDELGDTSTLLNPEIVETLVEKRKG